MRIAWAVWKLRWWRRRVWWKRFTHGQCVDCGVRPSLQGATVCRYCYERMRAEIWTHP